MTLPSAQRTGSGGSCRLWHSVLSLYCRLQARSVSEMRSSRSRHYSTRSPSLRAALTDPARSGDDKAALVQSLLGGKVAEQVIDLLSGMVRARWSAPRDIAEAVTRLGVEAVLVSAQRHDRLDEVQDELFRFAGTVASHPDLRLALTDRALPVERKSDLLTDLLKEKSTVESARLIVHAVTEPRGVSLEGNLQRLADAAAARHERQVATVTAAVPLTERQRERLSGALAAQIG